MKPTPEGDRGQLMLLAGVMLALVFVVLGVLLNSAAFTGAEAAREGVSDAGDVLSAREDVVEGVGGALFYANYYDHSGDYDGIVDALRTDVRNWSDVLAADATAHRTISGVELRSTTNGTQVYQDHARSFTDADDNESWTLAEDLTGIRRFAMNVSASVEDPDNDTVSDLNDSDAFRVVARGADGNETRVFIYNDSEGNIVVSRSENGAFTGNWSVGDDKTLVELTAGRIDGTRANLSFPGFGGTFDLQYHNADAIEGRYGLVVDNAGIATGPYASSPESEGPHQVSALYSATLEVRHRTATLDYVTNATVAPESTPEGPMFDVPRSQRELAYVDKNSHRLQSLSSSGFVTPYDVVNVAAIGPMEHDFDNDGRQEIPYVDSSNTLKVIDSNNETQTLASGVRSTTTLIGVGEWRGELSVFYANQSDNDNIYRVNWTSGGPDTPATVPIEGDSRQASAISGIADYNGDGDSDLVYLKTSSSSYGVTYVDNGTLNNVGRNVGRNNGVGVGALRDLDGNGVPQVPFVDGSGGVAALDSENQKTRFTENDPSEKSPVAGFDWISDGQIEVVYLDSETNELYYAKLMEDGVERLTNEDGEYIRADSGIGVA